MTTKHEQSYGIIPLKKRGGEWDVLLVQLYAGHWGFPKGHPEPHETPLETAQRELFEETGLTINKILIDQTLEEVYFYKLQGNLIHKKVIYYIAQVQGRVKKMSEEIQNTQWVSLATAAQLVTFDQAKSICLKVNQLLR